MRIKPLQNYILILPDEKVKKIGDFQVAEGEAEMSYTAKVIAVGEGIYENGEFIPTQVKKGDTVLHKSYGLTSVKIEGKEHFILEERNILGIVEDAT